MHQTTLPDGATLAYHDRGTGAALLMLHGFTGTARSHLGSLIDDLSQHYRVIAPDLRGYGMSRPPLRDFPPDFYQRDASDMAALLDRLAPGPVVVLGFSDGAESALVLAASRPDLVRGVVAWGVAGVIAPQMAAAAQRWLPVSAWGANRAAWRAEIVATQGEAMLEPLISGWAAAVAAILAAGGNIVYDQADQIRCPVLLINGDGEVNNLPEDVRRLAARIPNARLTFVTQSGHSIQDDQPEVLLHLIRHFLEQVC
ncbi:alpha/beta hydrolase fold protein [Oscillochloris trichoides DG-6]|uniref:Alpha/beta hydrolase fold protein n=1 Tax=Oscillochloris trichoides DG-6 TaxID=765420 RepID=E1IIG9_9CHLR|nr:alpha/beta hydrolase [Oscillochloris trichoides]EFO79044.1 alpha/beta hydrolase fold protein [Oscillochloris trichoides DG-6]